MIQKTSFFLLIAIILSSLVTFIACEETESTTPSVAPPTTSQPTSKPPTQTFQPTQPTSKPTSQPTQPSGPQQYGGILKIIASPGIQNLGIPGKAYPPGQIMWARFACEYLCSFNPDGSGEAVPELAERFEWAPDYKSLTLYLRKGIKFHDGTPFNAEAAKYNLELHKAGFRANLEPVESMEVLDEYTLRLNMYRYDSGFMLGLMSLSGVMYSPTFLEKAGDDALLHPVGTGPFKFVEYKRDVSLKYTRNDDYWQEGKPYLEGVEIMFIADSVTKLAVLKAGDAHVLQSVDVKDVPDLDKVGFNIVMSPGSVNGLAGDSKHPDSHYYKIEVRRAIAHAIDNEAIAKALGRGFWEPTNQWFPKVNPAHNPDIIGYPYNVQKAKDLLTKAGYPNGFDTEIWYEANSNVQADTYGAVQGYLAEVGINAKLVPTDRGAFRAKVGEGWNDHLVHMYTAVALGVDPVSTLRTKMCSIASRYDCEGSLWIPEDYDALYFATAEQTDFAKWKEGLQELSRLMIDEYLIAMPIAAPSNFLAKTPEVRDFDMHEYGLAEYRPENAWLEQ